MPGPNRPWTHLDDTTRAAVATRYAAGETSTTLATEYGVAKSTIFNILRAKNVVVRRQSLTPEQVKAAVGLYVAGFSLSHAAKQLQINQETMRVALLAAGTVLRPATGAL